MGILEFLGKLVGQQDVDKLEAKRDIKGRLLTSEDSKLVRQSVRALGDFGAPQKLSKLPEGA